MQNAKIKIQIKLEVPNLSTKNPRHSFFLTYPPAFASMIQKKM